VIFVVDSSDKERIDLAKEELHKHLEDTHLRATDILILVNKQDIVVMSVEEITEKMRKHTIKGKDWHVQCACATTGMVCMKVWSGSVRLWKEKVRDILIT